MRAARAPKVVTSRAEAPPEEEEEDSPVAVAAAADPEVLEPKVEVMAIEVETEAPLHS